MVPKIEIKIKILETKIKNPKSRPKNQRSRIQHGGSDRLKTSLPISQPRSWTRLASGRSIWTRILFRENHLEPKNGPAIPTT